MTIVRLAPVVLFLVAIATMPSRSAESVTGRWALDPAACSGFGFSPERSPLVVTDYAVRWRADSCRIERMYKTGDTVHIQAQCWGADGERSIPVSLRPHAGKLQLRWDRVKAGELRRCD
jgi:hypothetical protein